MEYRVSRKAHSLLDPRTKLLLLFLCSLIVIGGAGEQWMRVFYWILVILPLVLLLIEGKWKTTLTFTGIFIGSYLAQCALQHDLNPLESILALMLYIITKILPALVYGRYLIQTTKVSEFLAAMQKMHVSDKLTIPISVVFRFFPTIREESGDINNAMKMRGVALGGGKAGSMLEYRLVPLIAACSLIGEELSAAAMTRGLEVGTKRTCLWAVKFGPLDYVMLLFSVVCIIWLIIGRFFI